MGDNPSGNSVREPKSSLFCLQQPPSPWMNHRPPLDVNIGKLDGVVVYIFTLDSCVVISILLV